MKIRKAERRQAKIKLVIQGPSGSGKTYSSIQLANGLIGDLSKVCIVDTEHYSADLYAHLGNFQVISLKAPYTPEKYIQAIEIAEAAGMDLVIIDSLSHCWEYLLEYHSGLSGNTFANWSKVTPRHKAIVQRILTSPCHIIATLRVKQDYVLTDKNGKMVPEKVGLKFIQRDGLDYEFTVAFNLDMNHNATCTKDRTGLFISTSPFVIESKTGENLLDWCLKGVTVDSVRTKINKAGSIQDLTELYKQYRAYFPMLEKDFVGRKASITELLTTKVESNGITSS